MPTPRKSEAVKTDGHDIDRHLDEQLAEAEGVLDRYIDVATGEPRLSITVEHIIAEKAKQAGIKTMLPKQHRLASRKIQNTLKERAVSGDTFLGRAHLDHNGESTTVNPKFGNIDPNLDPQVGRIIFAALTDADVTLGKLAAKAQAESDIPFEPEAVAIYCQPDPAHMRTRRDGIVEPDRYRRETYLGVVGVFPSLEHAEAAAAELRQAVAFRARPVTDTAIEDDPVRSVGMDTEDPFGDGL